MPLIVAIALYGGVFFGYCIGSSDILEREPDTHRHLIHFGHRKATTPPATPQEPDIQGILDVDTTSDKKGGE